ncbi:hypothetical protein TNIN_45881 [Trichonephila inaurata madagascariensis]|uniref:Uncharacterized protein n=1 Tax=Trichonephila inaurata madagascariensis TaxID=2747483 RepID=A0A8X6WMR8_9ARAC|nr:hypothetical protein TNIN_45881 [Trichonephila inaurata madagascariensis]
MSIRGRLSWGWSKEGWKENTWRDDYSLTSLLSSRTPLALITLMRSGRKVNSPAAVFHRRRYLWCLKIRKFDSFRAGQRKRFSGSGSWNVCC